MDDPHPPTPFTGTITFADVAARVESIDIGRTLTEMRAGFARLMLGEDPPADPRPESTFGGVRTLVTTVGHANEHEGLGAAGGRVWVWFHGGGFVFGSPETHLRPTTHFARATGEAVVVPRYRLAPEHTWPAQRDDALAVAHGLQDAGYDVALAGDSAGGQIALVAALELARTGRPAVALALFSPNTDRTGLSDTRVANTPTDPMNSDADDKRLARMTFVDVPDDDPGASPVLDDLSLLPPTHVECGGREVLLGDSRVLVERARAAGAPITYHETPGAFHMWQLWTPWLPEGTASLDRAAAALAE